ncbi:type II toxin-antitoxin system RelE/ParE family toxin [Euzebya sp.]|uniref:type II toxin-antitoxin system RelE/ParE family toxin n=1 Tax=Euzebya sp. TaxID=1971409 RepID=UPI003513C552
MPWGTVELEPEVTEWLASLVDNEFGQVERYIDLLADEGVHLTEPFSRQLSGKLRELRFFLGRRQVRITYYIATGAPHRVADGVRQDPRTRAPRGATGRSGHAAVHRTGPCR